MNVILLKDVDKVGDKYEIVSVKPGFGRNYLIPQGVAVIANDTNKKKLEDILAKESAEIEKRLTEFQELAEKLKDKKLTIGAKTGTSGKIFGSITSLQIAQALQEQLEIVIERRMIKIPDEVRTLGEYTAVLDLHPDVDSKIDFEVVAE